MATRTKSSLEKLSSLEQQKQQLIKQRHQELLNIFIKHNLLTIDDKLLAGFLHFISIDANKSHPILSEFRQLASKPKLNNKKIK